MKNIFSFILIAISLNGNSQISDTSCIESRWISIKPIQANKNIFLQNMDKADSVDLVFIIKSLVEQEKMNIYKHKHSSHVNSNIRSWFNVDQRVSVCEKENDVIKLPFSEPYFEIIGYPVDPYMNSNFGDSVVISPDGKITKVYPPPYIIESLQARYCDEIRIKESRIYNKKSKRYEFVPVGLSIIKKQPSYSDQFKIFWVDLEELFNTVSEKDKYPWYNALKNKEYQGFQYMQVPCTE